MSLRNYRVAVSCFEPDLSDSMEIRREKLRKDIVECIETQIPDLVVMPEACLVPTFYEFSDLCAETLDGETIKMISSIAEKHEVNLCMPIVENDNEKKYNTAVYVNRKGDIAGKFRKYVPTPGEIDAGIRSGECNQEPVVLDGYRIGTSICFDENFPDLLWHYTNVGVDLLVFPSYTFGGKLIENWAITCGVPMVVAFPWESVIYDRDGNKLAIGGSYTTTFNFKKHPNWIASSINMQSRVYHLDKNQDKIFDMYKKYSGKINLRLMVNEARMMITVVSDDISIEQIEKEMKLESLSLFLRESRLKADNAR